MAFFKKFRFKKKVFLIFLSVLFTISLGLNFYLCYATFLQTSKQSLYPDKDYFSPGQAYEDAINWFHRENKLTIPYADCCPNLHVDPTEGFKSSGKKKVCYLTFDDGPSSVTMEMLDTLDKYKAKATFFVTGQNLDSEKAVKILQEIAKRGHTIGLHSYSHNYKKIYESVESFLEDQNKLFEAIKKHTGVEPNIIRFPGGSINSHNQHIYQELIAEMINRGFVIYDWNISSQDAVYPQKNAGQIAANATKYLKEVNNPIVLMHDDGTRTSTLNALPSILEYCAKNGYALKGLDNTVMPSFFYYKS